MALSLPPILPNAGITDGVYKIFNVQYPNQVADLVYPGGADGAIVGYNSVNDLSERVQWSVTNVVNGFPVQNQITLANQGVTTYAQEDISNLPFQVVGSTDVPETVWSVNPTPTAGHFYIFFAETLAWTLADGNDGTPITLEVPNIPTNDAQLWQFVPVD